MEILVLGSKGQLGLCLADQLADSDYSVDYASRSEIDISDFVLTSKKLISLRPDILINSAAYTAVDKAEEDQETATRVNHLAVLNIANTCKAIDCLLIHISTAYVFDGVSTQPYRELDKTNPQGVYGLSKLQGEHGIQSSGCKHIIIRTGWVFSEYGTNFVKTMLTLGDARDIISVVGDQVGCPTYAQDIAKTIVLIIENINGGNGYFGVYNYCGNTTCSWYEFARTIFDRAGKYKFSTPESLKSILTSEYPTLAARPKYSVLDCHKIEKNFGVEPSNLKAGIDRMLEALVIPN
jgi:dTDP-4-dehydrorhamnose reductase